MLPSLSRQTASKAGRSARLVLNGIRQPPLDSVAGPEVGCGARWAFSMSLCQYAPIKPPVRVRAKRKGGQGLHPSACSSIRFWVRVIRFGSCPLPDLVGNTDEGGGVRRAA